MIKAVIFDLDLTLVDSRAGQDARTLRNWPKVYKQIPSFKPYVGIDELIKKISASALKTAIVTSSPRPYCERVLSHFDWIFDCNVCFHDTALRKPHPAPMIEALKRLDVSANEAISVGDSEGDIVSSKAAGIATIGAAWGSEDLNLLIASTPQFMFQSVDELIAHLIEQGIL